ncbi:MAG TPA: HD domain-containing protein [Methanoregula sp.]|nr:HD domain-containing protein [Methanoregula sp.]
MRSNGARNRPDHWYESQIFEYTKQREALLSPSATRSDQALRRKNRKPEDIRSPYSRDADRIIHTRAYTRYIDKTQVFYLVENDHITHRVIHVQLVSKIARTIGRCLRLNEDLVEAIALGHDIGHIPYGHFGETCLSALCEEQGIGLFSHNVQSVRFLDRIEDQDLTMQVLDGILCHNGEADDVRISPEPCPDWQAFDRKVEANAAGNRSGAPMTLEGCVVKFADTIAFIGRDLQDAQEVGLINGIDDIPAECKEILGIDNRAIIDTLIHNLLENSEPKEDCFISYSPDVEHALVTLRAFSRKQIYNNPRLTAEREKIKTMYRVLFSSYLDDLESDRRNSKIFTEFTDSPWVNKDYIHENTPAGLVRDFIAGMTDRYFLKRFEDCVLPRRVDGSFR